MTNAVKIRLASKGGIMGQSLGTTGLSPCFELWHSLHLQTPQCDGALPSAAPDLGLENQKKKFTDLS